MLILPISICGAVVESVTTPACHAGGRGFESRQPRHFIHSGSGRIAQLGERLPYKQDVGGSSPSSPTTLWGCSRVGYNAGLSRRRSRVRVPSAPPFKKSLCCGRDFFLCLNEDFRQGDQAAMIVRNLLQTAAGDAAAIKAEMAATPYAPAALSSATLSSLIPPRA